MRCLAYLGEDVAMDGMDQVPFHRREGTKNALAPKGSKVVKHKELDADSKDRFTLTVLSSTHPPHRSPEVMFRGPPGCKPRDMQSVPENVTVRFGLKATYSSTTILQFLESKFAQPGILDALIPRKPRVLVLDQFSAHASPSVLQSIIKRYNRAPLLCFGGLTGLVQTADVFQNKV